MSDSLFDLSASSAAQPGGEDRPITDVQITQIRTEFDRLSIKAMTERKNVIEAAAMRPIQKLQDLTAVEARRVLRKLKESTPIQSASGGSSWDNREEETWIDKL